MKISASSDKKRNYKWTYVVHSIDFQTFFGQAFKIVVDSWKFSILLLYILWYDWPIFTIVNSNEQLQQQLKYSPLKPDCHSWWISKVKSGREDTLEERYAITFCFKLGKMREKRMECFRLLLEHLAWIEHQVLSGIQLPPSHWLFDQDGHQDSSSRSLSSKRWSLWLLVIP